MEISQDHRLAVYAGAIYIVPPVDTTLVRPTDPCSVRRLRFRRSGVRH